MKVKLVLRHRIEDLRIERTIKAARLPRVPVVGEYVATSEGTYIVAAIKWLLDTDLGEEVWIECEGLR